MKTVKMHARAKKAELLLRLIITCNVAVGILLITAVVLV